jgi:spoIIIJ-associated protein
VSQADNAGTVTSGDVAGQALAGDEADSATRVEPDLDHDADGLADATASDDADDVAEDDDDAAEDDADEEAAAEPAVNPADLEQESEIAADYVEGLLDVADLDGDIDMDVEGDRAVVSVVGATLEELIGPRGEVLEALQELTRLGHDAAEEVKSSGVPRRLEAMTPFERKVVHDAVAAAGLRSESEGEEPNRRVVVFPVG